MISHITQAFRALFAPLPAQVQQQARDAYQLFRQNPAHPSLRWKHVHPTRPIYSVRVGRGYRAVGIREADEVTAMGREEAAYWLGMVMHRQYPRRVLMARRFLLIDPKARV